MVSSNSCTTTYRSTDLPDVARGESGRYVIVTSDNDANTQLAYSNDGVTWASSILPQGLVFDKITYGDGLYVPYALGGLYVVSSDGVNFGDSILFSPTLNINRIRYGNGFWIAGTQDGRIFYTQNINANPSNWTQSVINLSSNITLNSVNDMAYGGPVGTWIAIGRGTFFVQPVIVLIYSKDDGRTWFSMDVSNYTDYDSASSPLPNMAIIYANNRFSVVAGGSLRDGLITAVYRSGRDENENWSNINLPINSANAISYRSEEYLIGGQNVDNSTSTMVRSTDGVNFTPVNVIVSFQSGQRFIVNGIA